jgi:prephenate dehydrogenase
MIETEHSPFGRIALIGAGLIGGSWALALRAAYHDVMIHLYDQNEQHRIDAINKGIAHQAYERLGDAVLNADLVILATPVGACAGILSDIPPFLGPHTVITDVGSIKRGVIESARQFLGDSFSRFVPGHPISGAEKSGPLAARADLFKDKRVVLTPVPETHSEALAKIRLLWEKVGAEIHLLDAAQHDEVFAAVSHLPHLLSYTLVEELAARPDAALIFSYAAGGFRDFTRIAESNPTMWRDISLGNAQALIHELDTFELKLRELRAALAHSDGEALLQLFQRAQKARSDWASGLN